MKKAIVFLTIILIFGCNDVNSKKEVEKENKDTNKNEYGSFLLDFTPNDEKISLLAIAKNVSEDTLSFIITDYRKEIDKEMETFDQKIDYKKIISELSKKYNFTQSKIANLIYSYEYEMITNEYLENDIIDESYIDQNHDPGYDRY
jgi:hypothetical protein